MTAEKENPHIDDSSLAAESNVGVDGAAGLPVKLARYSEARHRALLMRSFAERAGHVKEAARLRGCGDYLLFRDYFTVDKVRLHAASFCKQHLLCPLCAIRRGAKMLQAYLERFQAVTAANPRLRPFLVTLTVKNGDDLAERVEHLRRAYRVMSEQRRNAAKGLRAPVEFSKSFGGFHSIEVTNEGKGWHPHMHMVWLCESDPDMFELRREWEEITGDSFMCDVKPFEGDPVSAFMEVCKYALKFSGLSVEQNWEAYKVLKGQRLVDCHGLFRGVEIPDSLLDAPLDDLPYIELLYRFAFGSGYSLVRASAPQAPSPRPASEKLTGEAYRAALRVKTVADGVWVRRPVRRVVYSLWKPGDFCPSHVTPPIPSSPPR